MLKSGIDVNIPESSGNYGDNGPIIVEQTKDERDAKADKVYLGNVKIVWTNGTNVDAAPREGGSQQSAPAPAAVEDDLPF